MMLIRFSEKQGGAFNLGMEHGAAVYDLSSRFNTVRAFLEAHPDGWDDSSIKLGGFPEVPRGSVHVGPPLDNAAKE